MAVGHSAREGASGHLPLGGPPGHTNRPGRHLPAAILTTAAAEQGVNINDKHIEPGILVVSTIAGQPRSG
jgi:hypothetical protein